MAYSIRLSHILNCNKVQRGVKAGMVWSSFLMIFPERMRGAFLRAKLSIERLQEIRLRVGRPVLLRYGGTEYGLTKDGHLTDSVDPAGMCSLEEELSQVLEYASGYSVYAFYEEIRQGFFTIAGGHRIGVAGR